MAPRPRPDTGEVAPMQGWTLSADADAAVEGPAAPVMIRNTAAAVARAVADVQGLDSAARHRLLRALAVELHRVDPHGFDVSAFVAAYGEEVRRTDPARLDSATRLGMASEPGGR